MRSGARAKRPAFTEERVLRGAVSAPSGNSVQWLCFRGARTHRRTAPDFQSRSRRASCGKSGTPPDNPSRSPKTCPSRGAIPTWDVVQGRSGGAMSDPSPTTHRFDVSNNRRVRLRIGAVAMGAGIVVFAYVV